MSVLAITVQALLDAPAVTSIVGTRIHPVTLPQDTDLPNVLVTLASQSDGYILSGRSRFPEAIVIIDARAADFPTASDLSDAIMDALADVVSQPIAGHDATIMRGDVDVADAGETGRMFRLRRSYTVRWR